MRQLTAYCLLFLLLSTPLLAQEIRLVVPYETFTLPNGLNVILHKDDSTPTLTTNIWYHVGSAHERPGRTGFAHLFEHIMFEGSANVPRGKIDIWFEEVGGSPNGTTSQDRTNYFQTFGNNALDMALFIESDRMGFLIDAMHPEVVDGQRFVVQNERRQVYDNRPYGLAWETLGEHLYEPDFPYHWPVIGYMDDLNEASYDDVVDFFERFYVPNNASLVIAGDIDFDEARSAVEKWFGEIPRGEYVDRLYAPRPVLTQEKRIVMEDRVQLPRLYMAWLTPPVFAPGDAEMSLLGDLLTRGRNSRLYQKLVYELEIADDVSAYQSSGMLSSEFYIIATARSGYTLEEIERVIESEIDKLKSETPSERELGRVVNQYETRFLEQLERTQTKADMLNSYYFFTGNPDYFNEDLARFYAVDPTDISAMARRYLPADGRVVLSIVPEGREDLAAAESNPISAAADTGTGDN